MLGLVLANNFIMMFIFWELVGVSSYILIGHWFTRPSAADAANKAFIVNRIGDFGFMLGILMVWSASGTVIFDELGRNGLDLALVRSTSTPPLFLFFAVRLANLLNFLSTSGCLTRWKVRRRFRH